MAGLGRNNTGHSFLYYVQLSSNRDFLQGHRNLHFARQVRVVKSVRVADAFMWYEFKVLASERMTLARGEVRKRHLMCPADFGIHVVNLSSESVRRKPLAYRVWIKECSIHTLMRRTQDPVKPDSIC